jgi:heme-binding protein
MSILKRVLQVLIIIIAAGIIVAQFVGPVRSNPVTAPSQSADTHLQISPEVRSILIRSCGDCHSNDTRWPWYSNVAPVSWFVIDHVNHGRQHLNFSEWGRYTDNESEEMLEHICKEVKSGSMPLTSYTSIHKEARLSEGDVKVLCDWARVERTSVRGRLTAEARR